MSITVTPGDMAWARKHIPANILQGMLADGFLKEVKTEETEKRINAREV